MPRRNINIGDLVRLRDDKNLSVGVGLVLAEKDSNSFAEAIKEQYYEDPNYIEEIEEFLLYKPIYLVLWQGDIISSNNESPVWMFVTELDLIEAKQGK